MMRIFFLLLTTLALFSCQNEQKPDSKTLNCYVRFDADANLVTVEANLVDDKTKKNLEFPDGITFQKMPMKLVSEYNHMYQFETNSLFQQEQAFAWDDEKASKQVFKNTMDSLSQVSLGGGAVSLSKAATLTWQGPSLTKGETLLFMWQNAATGDNQTLEVSSTNPQPVIDIPAEKLKKLSPGKWSLYLVRKKLFKGTAGEVKVNCISEFYSKPISVALVK